MILRRDWIDIPTILSTLTKNTEPVKVEDKEASENGTQNNRRNSQGMFYS